jgi:hypothetical protein
LRSGITPDTVPPFVTASPELTMKRLMTCLFVTLWCALETACFGGLAPPVPVTSPNSDDEQPPVVDERARVELLTSEGSIMLALDEARAPITATNFCVASTTASSTATTAAAQRCFTAMPATTT